MATVNVSTFSPLRLLRHYLHARPNAKSAVCKTVGFGGASYITISLSTPIRIDSKAQSTMAAAQSDGEDMRGRTQQSPLASQRASEQDQTQQGRFAQWFPLGAKEGFSQWVSGSRFQPDG